MKLSREKFEQIFLLDIKLNRFKYIRCTKTYYVICLYYVIVIEMI